MVTPARIVITPGEPAGIGPDVTLQIAQLPWPVELCVVADPELLRERARQLHLPIQLTPIELTSTPSLNQVSELKILPQSLNVACESGKLNAANSSYVMQCLEVATDACLNKFAHALVTGPINKSIINAAQIPFTGHTEFLATHCKVSQTIMLFVMDDVKVALATTHIPLSQVSNHITTAHLTQLIRLLQQALQHKWQISHPQIYVSGLNPHAGEGGLLGHEEQETIIPTLEQLRSEGINVIGPLPADTLFTQTHLQKADVILAMYHDQALPVVKHLGFDRAVNVTLGLPIIRTSVDHGSALEIAGTGKANAGSLKAAINLAIRLTN